MKNKIWIIVGLVLFAFLGLTATVGVVLYVAYLQHPHPFTITGKAALEPTPYTDAAKGFRIRIPLGWKLTSQPTVDEIWKCPTPDPVGDRMFTANISVTNTPGTGDYAGSVIRTHQRDHPDFVLLSNRHVTINGLSARIIDYTFTTKNHWKNHIQQTILPANGKIYIITAGTHDSAFALHRPQFESSLASFQPIP